MKLLYFGFDLFADVLQRVIDDGHTVARLFTCPVDNHWSRNTEVLAIAARHRIPVTYAKPTQTQVDRLWKGGAELMLSAGYPWRIPCAGPLRGINLHPSLLPEGRGRWPLPWHILRYPQHAGLSLHKLTPQWDEGEILAHQQIQLTGNDDLETLTARLRLAAPGVVSRVLADLDQHWRNANPQSGGSTWPAPSLSDRLIEGRRTVEANLRIVRAFGNFESKLSLGGTLWNVTSASGWVEPHSHSPGTIILRNGQEMTMAVADGFVVLRSVRPEPQSSVLRQVLVSTARKAREATRRINQRRG